MQGFRQLKSASHRRLCKLLELELLRDAHASAPGLLTLDMIQECFAASSLAEFKKHQASEYKASQVRWASMWLIS